MSAIPPRSLAVLAAVALLLTGCGGSGGSATERRPSGTETLPPQGEYSYVTSGFERLSAVVASRHGYPRVSSVTVTREGCGFGERWEPRPERSSESRFCVAGARWRLSSFVDYHEFFGQPVTQRFTCQGPFVARPPTVPVGFRWKDRCRGAGSRVTVRYQAMREERISVAGRPVDTILVRARAALRGRIDGVNLIFSWLSRQDGLLVRRKVRSDTAVHSPFGTLADRERYTLKARSLGPR